MDIEPPCPFPVSAASFPCVEMPITMPFRTDTQEELLDGIRKLMESRDHQLIEEMATKPSQLANAIRAMTRQSISTNATLSGMSERLDAVCAIANRQVLPPAFMVQMKHLLGDNRAELKFLNERRSEELRAMYTLNSTVERLTTVVARLEATHQQSVAALQAISATQLMAQPRPNHEEDKFRRMAGDFDINWERYQEGLDEHHRTRRPDYPNAHTPNDAAYPKKKRTEQ